MLFPFFCLLESKENNPHSSESKECPQTRHVTAFLLAIQPTTFLNSQLLYYTCLSYIQPTTRALVSLKNAVILHAVAHRKEETEEQTALENYSSQVTTSKPL